MGFFPLLKGPAAPTPGPVNFLGVTFGDCSLGLLLVASAFWADFTIVVSCSILDSTVATLAIIGLAGASSPPTTSFSTEEFSKLALLCNPIARPLSDSISAALAAFSNCV